MSKHKENLMKLLFKRHKAKYFANRLSIKILTLCAIIIGATSSGFGQPTSNPTNISPRKTPPPGQQAAPIKKKKVIEEDRTFENQNNIKFPDEYSELDNNSTEKKSQDKAIAKILDRSKQKYLQALKLIQKKDTINAARFFEHAIDILNKAASYQGIENNEEYSELAQSIIDDYETYIKSIDELDEKTSMVLVRDKLFQEFEKIQTTPDLNEDIKSHKPLPTLSTPTNLVIPLDSHELVDRSIFFLTEKPAGKAFFKKILSSSTRWFPMMKRIAREEGMPEEIVIVSTFESALNPNAVSPAGAVGLWQFMRATGQDYGLNARPSIWLDERRDPEKSTRAAMRYLKALHQDFGDWYLAMSAYNAGPGRIRKAMKKLNSSDSINYWAVMEALNIRETRGYAPMFIAIAKVMYNMDKFGIDQSKINFEPEYKYDTYTLNEPVSLSAIAKAANTNLKEIQDLNPELINGATPADLAEYKIKIPFGSLPVFSQNFPELTPDEKMPWMYYATKTKKESLASVAQKYGVSIAQLASANENVSKTGRLPKGTRIKIPVGKKNDNTEETTSSNSDRNNNNRSNSISTPQAPQPAIIDLTKKNTKAIEKKYKNYPSHKVAKGETIYTVALKYGMRPSELKEMNALPIDDDRIREGQILKVNPAGNFKVDIAESTPSNNNISNNISNSTNNRNTINANPSQNNSIRSQQPKQIKHTVKRNEHLAQIAKQYGITIADIKANNRIGKHLKAGQVLTINTNNDALSSRTPNVPTPKAKTNAIPATYTVQRGEKLADIAAKYNLDVNTIAKNNNLKKGRIKAGQVLNLQLSTNNNIATNQKAGAKNKKSTHTVQKGETLETIANQYQVSQEDLKAWNPKQIKGNTVFANTELVINSTSAAQSNTPAKANTKSSNKKKKKSATYYTIKKGDTLEKIARKFDTSVDDLTKANGKNKTKVLQIGEKIKVE